MDFDLTSIFGGPMGTSLFGGPGGPIFGGKAPGAGKMFSDMSVPGMPATGGMLRAGDDDMKPPGMEPPGAGLLKAGLEGGPLGGARGMLAQNPATGGDRNLADAPAVGAQNSQFIIPGTGQAIPVGDPAATTTGLPSAPKAAAPAPALATPAGSGRVPDPDRMPSAVPTATIPNSRGGPDERGAPQAVPIIPPKIDVTKPTAGGGTVGGQAAPPVAGAAPVADPATTGTPGAAQPGAGQPGASPGMDKFREWLSKTGSISGKQTPPPQGRSPGAVGAPHIPQGGAALLQSILDAHAKAMPKVAPIGQLPPGLLRRFQGA